MGLLDRLNEGANGDIDEHFDRVAKNASSEELGQGLAAAMRSEHTPPFADMVAQLFGRSSSEQRAGLLNQILVALGSGGVSALAGGVLGHVLRPGQIHVTPDAAARVTPEQAKEIAAHAQQQRPDVVEEVSRFYAQHAGLIKTLGGAALAVALVHIQSAQGRR